MDSGRSKFQSITIESTVVKKTLDQAGTWMVMKGDGHERGFGVAMLLCYTKRLI